MSERADEQTLAALRLAIGETAELRLHRAGKLAGLFPPRSELARKAIADGLLEVVRTETKGKSTIEWVRITPNGVDFLHSHESPRTVLLELQSALKANQQGVPIWLEQMHQQWQSFATAIVEQMKQMLRRLDALSQRVEDALRRADAVGPSLPHVIVKSVPWGVDALAYLDRRRESGAPTGCPLPELFVAVRRQSPELSLADFQAGLRRLSDHKAINLTPSAGPAEQLPQPEYALLDGGRLLYYASR